MHNLFDHLAKKVGKKALSASGRTVVQHEISRDAQYADIRHDPDPARAGERARLGLLGRIASVLCLIEIYGHAPRSAEIRACLSKHFAHWEECDHKTRAQNKKRREQGLPPKPFVAPMLWIVVATVSAPMLRRLKVETAPGWPAGIWFLGDPFFRAGLIVASKLPRDRSTILLRIMAAGRKLPEAIADLAELPTDAPERTAAEQILVHLHQLIGKKPRRTAEEEEFIVSMLSPWEKARREEAAKTRARDVLSIFRVRGIPVPKAVRERILIEKDLARLERWLERAILAESAAEVIDRARRAA